MSKEKIDLSKAVRDDKFIARNGNELVYLLCSEIEDVYPHILLSGGMRMSYKANGSYCSEYGESVNDIVEVISKELPKYYDEPERMTWIEAMAKYENHPDYRLMTKDELLEHYKDNSESLKGIYWSSSENDNFLACNVTFNNGLYYGSKFYSLRVRVVNREMVDCQVNDTENLTEGQLDKSQYEEAAVKYDHKAMSEVFDALKMEEIIEAIKEVEDYVKVNCDHKPFKEASPESVKAFDEAIDEHLDREKSTKKRNNIIEDYLNKELDSITETTITAKALLNLGFKEEYQPPIDGEAGFLFYSFQKHGIELLSDELDESRLVVFLENQDEIHNLRTLGDFILSLKELK